MFLVTLVHDASQEPVDDAKVEIFQGNTKLGFARTDSSGNLNYLLPSGDYRAKVLATGRDEVEKSFALRADGQSDSANETKISMTSVGLVKANITDDLGNPIACKASFDGIEGTPNPNFGPDSRAFAMQNVRYCQNGKFEQGIGPGKYEAIVSHGTEFDARIIPIEIKPNQTTTLAAKLNRSVETPGWVSTEFHSHSTPSGDNASDQLGRVLNLLTEQIDFAPCTEHNRIDSYLPHLESLDVVGKMATCPGLELTGSPLRINHQNTFPMIMRPRTQDGGAPKASNNPVHPLGKIYTEVSELAPPGKPGNTIFNWLQFSNLGYRIPGVINADAHWNFHGSGHYRNYVRSSTDDPAEIDPLEIVRNSIAGRIVMSGGPYLSVSIQGQSLVDGKVVTGEIGDELQLKKDSVKLLVKVQCPNWLDVSRVQIVVNGRLEKHLNFTRRNSENMFKNGTVKFEQEIPNSLKEDSHLIVSSCWPMERALRTTIGIS